MKAIVIGANELRRTFRVRTNLLFLFVVPLLMILVLGLTFGGMNTERIGVVTHGSGALGQDLYTRLQKVPSIEASAVADAATLRTEVARGDLSAGVIVPSGYDAALRSGKVQAVTFLARPGTSSQQLGETVRTVVAQQSETVGAAQFAAHQGAGQDFDSALTTAEQLRGSTPAVSVLETTAGEANPSSINAYAEGAWTELLLFVFLMALLGGAIGLIESRRLGLTQRMLSTPTSSRTLIGGMVLGRVSVCVVQAAIIIAGSAIIFGVRWGDPLGVTAVVLLFALAASGFGLLLGTLLRNEQQGVGIALLLGLGLAAIGGCMVPLEVFPPVMKQIAHVTPHAWANDAFAQLVAHNASISQILPQLAVIATYALLLLGAASWRLRRVLAA